MVAWLQARRAQRIGQDAARDDGAMCAAQACAQIGAFPVAALTPTCEERPASFSLWVQSVLTTLVSIGRARRRTRKVRLLT